MQGELHEIEEGETQTKEILKREQKGKMREEPREQR